MTHRCRLLDAGCAIALLTAQSVSAAVWVFGYQVADDDAGHAVMLARACRELGQCTGSGTGTSSIPLSHGASWIRLIGYFLGSGGSLRSVQIVVLVALIASEAIACWIAWRYASPRAAILLLLFYLPPAMAVADFPWFVNSNLLVLPLALYYAATALCIERGSSVAAALGAVFLAGAMSANLSAALLFPFHLALVGVFARRPWRTVAAAAIALAVTFTVESSDAARALAGFVSRPLALFAAAILAVAFVVRFSPRGKLAAWVARGSEHWQSLRRRLASLPVRSRVRAAMKAAILWVSLTAWVGWAAAAGSIPPAPRALAPIVLPLLFLAAESTDRLSMRGMGVLSAIGFVAVVLFPFLSLAVGIWGELIVALSAMLLVCWPMRRRVAFFGPDLISPVSPGLAWVLVVAASGGALANSLSPVQLQRVPVASAERLARGLYESGLTFPEIFAARQLPWWFGETLPLIAAFDPKLYDAPAKVPATDWSLLPLVIDSAAVPQTEGLVLSEPIDRSKSVVAVRAPSYVGRTQLRRCEAARCGEVPRATDCTGREPSWRMSTKPAEPIGHLWPYLDKPIVRSTDSCLIYAIPIQTPGSHVPHILRVVDHASWQARITRIDGVEFRGELPASEVTLVDERESTGTMEVELSPQGFLVDGFNLGEPPMIEVTAANEHLLAPFRRGGFILW
jgi:hypothetical protein